MAALPRKQSRPDRILSELKKARKKDVNWKDGKVFSLVFYPGEEIYTLLQQAYQLFFSENGLNPSAFPSLRKFETDVVSMVGSLLHAPRSFAGSMTSGGTESILLAVYTAREWAREQRPKITRPEMVVAESAHPAFDKAAHYFGLKVHHIPVKDDFRADVPAMEAAINKNTILLVGSAPQYPQGVVDPIQELGQIALKHKILLHTDACVGGMMLPFVRKLGYHVPDFDFKVPGVTSLSVDIHKYGYAAKGASVVLYRNKALRRKQFFVYTGWTGGIYGSPGVLGTRAGGSIAAAWAVMQYLGEEGYLKINREVMQTVSWLQSEIHALPGIRILGEPHGTVMSIGPDYSGGEAADIYQLGDELAVRGWHLDKQQNPASLHLTVNYAHTASREAFLADLKAALLRTRKWNWHTLSTKMQIALAKGLAGILPASAFARLSRAQGKLGRDVPRRSAAMYGMMGALPREGDLDQLVLDFLDKLYTPEK
ncbi:MAG: aspartate aminotransferase family protein [Spirochaetales bacterium]|nr:aspartate aminotransferase family protein [Spirochaetales bacterium]